MYSREDDLVIALKQATESMADGRFQEIARVDGDVVAANRVTKVADIYLAWLRRVKLITLTLVAIEEQDDGTPVDFSQGGTVTSIDTSQQARYVIDAADDRGFPVDASLTVEATPTGVVTATILEAPDTASGKDELVVVAVAPGSALVRVFDANNPDVFGSDNVDVVPGGVAAVVLATPSVEEQPAP